MILEQNILPFFDETLDQMIKDLKSYAKRPEAKEYIINKRNAEIEQLMAIRNAIEIPCLDGFLEAFRQMEAIDRVDPQNAGHLLSIRTRPIGNNFSFTEINNYNET